MAADMDSSQSPVLRRKSDPGLLESDEESSEVRFGRLRGIQIPQSVKEVVFGTKLALLFPAIPLAVFADLYGFGGGWIFALSLLGLIPLAERLSFLTEQIAYSTGSTVGGLLNATCGNATEMIVAILALKRNKMQVLKYSLLGSVLSNLLLVLGTSLLCGGLANPSHGQTFDRKQADVNTGLLFLGLLCHVLPLMATSNGGGSGFDVDDGPRTMLLMSRASSIVMLLAYAAYIFFQLKTNGQSSSSDIQEEEEDADKKGEIGFWNAFGWLVAVTTIIALLSDYVVDTIEVFLSLCMGFLHQFLFEAASSSWGIPISFVSLILLPLVGNAAEHAGSIIFALRNKLDISLGVTLGSATQISLFVVPLCVYISWMMGGQMDLGLGFLETGSLAFAIIITAFSLQDGTSHYMKGVTLALCYVLIAACFFLYKIPSNTPQGQGELQSTA